MKITDINKIEEITQKWVEKAEELELSDKQIKEGFLSELGCDLKSPTIQELWDDAYDKGMEPDFESGGLDRVVAEFGFLVICGIKIHNEISR